MDLLVRGHFQHHGVQLHLYAGVLEHIDEPSGVLGTGELLAKPVETKAVVDALVQDAAQFLVTLQDQDVPETAFPCFAGGCKTSRTAADNHQINHCSFLLPSFR